MGHIAVFVALEALFLASDSYRVLPERCFFFELSGQGRVKKVAEALEFFNLRVQDRGPKPMTVVHFTRTQREKLQARPDRSHKRRMRML